MGTEKRDCTRCLSNQFLIGGTTRRAMASQSRPKAIFGRKVMGELSSTPHTDVLISTHSEVRLAEAPPVSAKSFLSSGNLQWEQVDL
jgi:hypothetical protein